MERSKYDMPFKYFLDMSPEESVINPSSLTKFRKMRLKDMNLLELLINKIKENGTISQFPKVKGKKSARRTIKG